MPSGLEDRDVQAGRIRCGLALSEKKLKRYATSRVIDIASGAGVDVVAIDIEAPLDAQGEFNIILHKLVPSHSFYTQLEEYSRANPNCRIVDEPRKVKSIQSRGEMLCAFSEQAIQTLKPGHERARQGASESGDSSNNLGGTSDDSIDGTSEDDTPASSRRIPVECTYSAPNQTIIPRQTTASDMLEMIVEAGLQYPIISKPLASDGTEGSHGITLLFMDEALQALIDKSTGTTATGFVLQQYHEHGGVLYKVYVLGHTVEVAKRPSLQLPTTSHMRNNSSSGWLVLPRFSTTPVPEEPSSPATRHRQHDSFSPRHFQGIAEGQPVLEPLPFSPTEQHVPPLHSEGSEGQSESMATHVQSPRLHRELSRDMAHQRPRMCRNENGRSMISWTGRTGSGRDLDFAVVDPRDPGGCEPRASLDEIAARTPPEWSLRQMAEQLRERMGLSIFNMDIICPKQQVPGSLQYYVVDINYFPGFDKLHKFEEKFASFLIQCGNEEIAGF